MPKENETDVKCVIPGCDGYLIKDVRKEFIGHEDPIIGVASERQYSDVSHGYYCSKCMVMYHDLPEQMPAYVGPSQAIY